MRYSVRFLSVCALVLIPFIACMDAGGGEEGCDLPECIGDCSCYDVVCPPDDNECTEEYCSGGTCRSRPVTDGTNCIFEGVSGVCVEGVCREDLCADVVCDDGDACTDDTCDYMDGCVFTAAACDDYNLCIEDTCDQVDGCIFTALEDGTNCEDDDTARMCVAGECSVPCDRAAEEVYQCPIDGLEDLFCCLDRSYCQDVCCESPEDCDDGNECTEYACADGLCEYNPFADGTACENDAGACQGGSCVGTFACTEQGILDAIAAGGGPHTFDCGGSNTVVTQATIEINNDVILDGEGNLTVHANDSHRVFMVWSDIRAELRGITITGGASQDEYGGGIRAFGALKLTNSTVSGNSAFRYGGGIVTQAKLELTNSTVSGNSAGRYGGGIANYGTLIMANSTVSDNFASEGGGGIYKHTTLPINVMTLTHSTVSGNRSNSGSSGIFGYGRARLTNTLIDNYCSWVGEIVSGGYNIESSGDTCGFDQSTDQVDVTADDLRLGPLQNNGGLTETHALGEGSVVIDRILAEDCLDADGEPLTTDQRGLPRPAGTTDPKRCDVGAFEVQP